MPKKENISKNSFYSKSIVVFNFLTTTLILCILTINVQDSSGFMADTKEMFNLFILFILAICYYFFIKHLRQLYENYLKPIILISHILLYSIIQYLFIDNSINKNLIDSEGYALWHKSSVFFAVPTILILDIIMLLYILLNRKKAQ